MTVYSRGISECIIELKSFNELTNYINDSVLKNKNEKIKEEIRYLFNHLVDGYFETSKLIIPDINSRTIRVQVELSGECKKIYNQRELTIPRVLDFTISSEGEKSSVLLCFEGAPYYENNISKLFWRRMVISDDYCIVDIEEETTTGFWFWQEKKTKIVFDQEPLPLFCIEGRFIN